MPSTCDCSEPSWAIEANPDIAGLGVVISFMLTAFLTFCALLVGYISDSIPDTTINRIDYLMVERVRKLLSLSPLRGGLTQEQRVTRNTQAYRQAKRRRINTLERFVLALSDQQLVTGIAILIAGYIKPCSMDLYHFQILAALAWFSSTTHLSTLALVRDYLINHSLIRTWRVAGMVIMLIMLLAAQVFLEPGDLASPSIYCTMETFKSDQNLKNIVNPIGIILFLLLSYGNNIIRLYSNDSNISLFGWLFRVVEDSLGMTISTGPQSMNQHTTKLSLASEKGTGKEHRERERDASLKLTLHSLNQGRTKRGKSIGNGFVAAVHTRYEILVYLLQEIDESFIGKILWIIFGNAYGIIGIILARWQSYVNIELIGNENEMGFGQIVPLLLMLLPVLAAGEAYYDLRPLPTDDGFSISGDSSTPADTTEGTPLHEIAVLQDSVFPSCTDSLLPTIVTRTTYPVASDDFITAPVRTDTESGLRNDRTMRQLVSRPTNPQSTLCTRALSHASASSQTSAPQESIVQGHRPQDNDIDPYSLRLLELYAVIIIITRFVLYVFAAFVLSGLVSYYFYFCSIWLFLNFYVIFPVIRIFGLFVRMIINKCRFEIRK